MKKNGPNNNTLEGSVPDTIGEEKLQPTAEKSIAKNDGFSVYIGPSIRGVIQSGTIVGGTRNAALTTFSTAIEQYPRIADLVVSGETLVVDRIKVKTAGNLLNKYYNDLVSTLKSK